MTQKKISITYSSGDRTVISHHAAPIIVTDLADSRAFFLGKSDEEVLLWEVVVDRHHFISYVVTDEKSDEQS